MLEAHAVCDQMQCLDMNEWVEDWEANWDVRLKNEVLWRTSIAEMTMEVMINTWVLKATPAQEARTGDRTKNAWQDGGGIAASLHTGATQVGEPEKCQLHQQPQPKAKLQLKQQPALQHQPKPKPTPTPARM